MNEYKSEPQAFSFIEFLNQDLQSLNLPQIERAGELKPDMRNPIVLELARMHADMVLQYVQGAEQFLDLESWALSRERRDQIHPIIHLSIKLARSKLFINSIDKEVRLAIVIPMYHEDNRIRRRGTNLADGQHPNGEDFITEKYKQLAWLTNNNNLVSYTVTLIDDQCPYDSGELAEEVISKDGLSDFEVVYLDELISHPDTFGVLVENANTGLTLEKNSKKAGAVRAGMAYVAELKKGDIVIYTDSDLSADLGQIGLIIQPIVDGECVSSTADRRGKLSYVERSAGKGYRRKLLMSLREGLFPDVFPLDTQCGLKAFSAAAIRSMLLQPLQVRDFSFDMELIAADMTNNGIPIRAVGIAWFDSPEESTTNDDVYFNMVTTMALIAQNYPTLLGPEAARTINIVRWIATDRSRWEGLLEIIAQNNIFKNIKQDRSELGSLKILDALEDLINQNYGGI